MGRLNYSNRKIEGEKLGQVCAKDLVYETVSFLGRWPDYMQTKRLPGCSSYKAALRDCSIELEIPSKSLTDVGFAEVATGIINTYSANTEEHSVIRLEELNLSNNDLTPYSLIHLSKVISVACHDLHDLDISRNRIAINSRDEAVAWEGFLQAISKCCMLRRIELSHNPLGAKALEVFSKVYSQEDPIDLVLPPDLAEIFDLHDLKDGKRRLSSISTPNSPITEIFVEATKHARRGSRHAVKLNDTGLHKQDLYVTTLGLRAIPYIILAGSLIDEASALYLSYVIAHHHDPHILSTRVPTAKAGLPAQQLATYNSSSSGRGIIYSPCNGLPSSGTRVLSLAESVRGSLAEREGVGDVPMIHDFDQAGSELTESNGRRMSQPRLLPPHEGLLQDLDRARSRIQANCIETFSPYFHDLWIAALKMLVLSRLIRPQNPKAAVYNSKVSQLPTFRPKQLVVRTLEILPTRPAKKSNPWGTPLAPRTTNTALNSQQRPSKGGDGTSIDIPPKAMTRVSIVAGKVYRSKLPCGFTEEIWRCILGFAAGAEGLLSPSQQRSVLNYGMNKQTLRKEQDMLGLREAQQIWHCLDHMDCLHYAMR